MEIIVFVISCVFAVLGCCGIMYGFYMGIENRRLHRERNAAHHQLQKALRGPEGLL